MRAETTVDLSHLMSWWGIQSKQRLSWITDLFKIGQVPCPCQPSLRPLNPRLPQCWLSRTSRHCQSLRRGRLPLTTDSKQLSSVNISQFSRGGWRARNRRTGWMMTRMSRWTRRTYGVNSTKAVLRWLSQNQEGTWTNHCEHFGRSFNPHVGLCHLFYSLYVLLTQLSRLL